MTPRQQARPRRNYRAYETTSLTGVVRATERLNLGALLRPRVIGAMLLVVLIGLAIWSGVDDRFYISAVKVTGNARVPANEITTASGILGLQVFWFNANEVEAHLTTKLPSIKSAHASCQLLGACTIVVQERQPVIAWQFGNAVTWIDAGGVTFAARVITDTADAPITVEAMQGPALFSGSQADMKIVQAALAVAREMPEVRRYRYSAAHGLEFDDARGFAVYLGLGPDMAERVSLWKALSTDLDARKAQPKFVDVRYPAAPFYGQ
jgi:cell division septal protein FtsQ